MTRKSYLDIATAFVSPYKEMLAFETLWAMRGMTEKKMSEIFNEFILPSSALLRKERVIPSDIKSSVENYLKNIDEKFFSISIRNDYQYPEKLRTARYPVELFYYKGDIGLAHSSCISIVGSRNCSENGRLRTKRVVNLLVKKGITIVSGLAKGIDTEALKTAISAKGKVIGVIGTPINQYYPKENKALQDLIAKDHLLISQVPFYRYNHEPFQNRRNNFPRRNATMSAMSDGTVIIEASETSGTLTQAREAIYQKKKLFILNSCFENKSITWPERFLQQGAIRVRDFEDIIRILEKKSD